MKFKNKLFDYKMDDIIKFSQDNKKLFSKNRNKYSKKIFVNTNFNWEKII